MNPLLRHVGDLVHAHDALAVARGATWKELWIRTCIPGGSSADVRYRSDSKAIHFDRSPEGPGQVTWNEFAEMIRAGLTDQLVADLEAALADWNRYNHEPATRGDLTYASCVGRMRELTKQVVANALGAQPVQLDLFGAVA